MIHLYVFVTYVTKKNITSYLTQDKTQPHVHSLAVAKPWTGLTATTPDQHVHSLAVAKSWTGLTVKTPDQHVHSLAVAKPCHRLGAQWSGVCLERGITGIKHRFGTAISVPWKVAYTPPGVFR